MYFDRIFIFCIQNRFDGHLAAKIEYNCISCIVGASQRNKVARVGIVVSRHTILLKIEFSKKKNFSGQSLRQ